jgi:hypothetical protein
LISSGRHAGDRALLESEIDERVLEIDRVVADVADRLPHRGRQAVALLGEGVEQLGDALAMEALVADAPRDDLAHALHLVEAREIHQHREAGEELKPLGEAAEHGERLGDVLVGVDAEGGEIIVLVLHLLILKEHAIFALRHADRIEQVRISGDVHRLHVGESGEHHLDLGRLEDAAIFFVVAILHLDVRLGEEAEDLGEQVALVIGELLRPIAAILAEGTSSGIQWICCWRFQKSNAQGYSNGLYCLRASNKGILRTPNRRFVIPSLPLAGRAGEGVRAGGARGPAARTPHPALRATFPRKGGRECGGDCRQNGVEIA